MRTYVNAWRAQRALESNFGIGNSEQELVEYLNSNLQGLTREEAMDLLSQWGAIESEECSNGTPFSRCDVHVTHFLDTELGFVLTVFYEDSIVSSVNILRS